MRPLALSLAASAALLLAAACSGPAEDAAHAQANAVDAAGERQADALERQAAATPNEAEEKALNRQADAVENAADGKSDAMHRQVDKDY
jgi:ABC-type glycerol-3-phosphate transport system substrate-binding protein